MEDTQRVLRKDWIEFWTDNATFPTGPQQQQQQLTKRHGLGPPPVIFGCAASESQLGTPHSHQSKVYSFLRRKTFSEPNGEIDFGGDHNCIKKTFLRNQERFYCGRGGDLIKGKRKTREEEADEVDDDDDGGED
ncbi:hypothetical protein RUM43_008664 [Polyplax serrata]|uniref:Uncharacterized protein n=1 Tax=Polyplax serrata TaxID=468196 RepID=A0AAN8NYT5_POLSC